MAHSAAMSNQQIAVIMEEDDSQNRGKLSKGACQPDGPHDWSVNVCFCTERKRDHQCSGKVHLIESDLDDHGVPARKRARIQGPGGRDECSCMQHGCCNGDQVHKIRMSVLAFL